MTAPATGRRDEGSYAVEFAVAVPVLLLALLVVAVAAIDATATAQAARAVRQAARAASLTTSPGAVQTVADTTARGNLRAGLCRATQVDTALATSGDLTLVTVVVRCQLNGLIATRTIQAAGDAVLDRYRAGPGPP